MSNVRKIASKRKARKTALRKLRRHDRCANPEVLETRRAMSRNRVSNALGVLS